MEDNTDIVQQILSHLQSLKQPDYGTAGALGGAIGAYVNGNNVGNAYGASAADAESQANTLKNQMDNMPTLESMYGMNSPYALQMQKQLAAKDAASGRNSQYGPRAQALQAALADKASTYAAQQAQSAQAYNTARANANQQRVNATTGQAQVQAQQLGSLFNLGEKSGILPAFNQGISNMAQPYIQKANSALGDMFPSWNSSNPAPTQQDVSTYSQGGPSMGIYGSPIDQVQQPYQSNSGMGQMYGQGNDYVNPDNLQTYQQPSGTDLQDQY